MVVARLRMSSSRSRAVIALSRRWCGHWPNWTTLTAVSWSIIAAPASGPAVRARCDDRAAVSGHSNSLLRVVRRGRPRARRIVRGDRGTLAARGDIYHAVLCTAVAQAGAPGAQLILLSSVGRPG